MSIAQSLHQLRFSTSLKTLRNLTGRILEASLAILALLLLWPILLVTAGVIYLDSPGSIFFRQKRLGFNGREFTLLKFRTMRQSAEQELSELLSDDDGQQSDWIRFQKLKDDPRLTRCGRWLRRWSLDEMPQIINILAGDMSWVGPRPILPEQRAEYGPSFTGYVQVRPGLTGLWQVSGRNLTTFAERIQMDQSYLERRSFRSDIRILLRTVGVVISGVGAY